MKNIFSAVKSVLILILISISGFVNSQYSGGGLNISLNNSYVSSLNFDETNAWNKVFITDRPVAANIQTGSPFVSDEWQTADIVLADKKSRIVNVPVRIDAKYNLLEINHEEHVKVLHANNTFSLVFKKSNDIYITNQTLGLEEPEGFFKVIYNDNSSLLCHYGTKIIHGAYNPVLAAGIKEDKLVIDPVYYIYKDGKLTKLENNRRKLMKQFKDQPDILQFVDEQHLNPKAEADLLKLVKFIDSKS
jgi:hypothetical protein